MKPLASLLKLPILVYRQLVSPLLGPRCRFVPSCSEYALDALEKHGPWHGGLLALRRVARCHPLTWLGGGSGFDPVPERSSRAVAQSRK
jgi:putative membrane protein insertion efficiency factor